jgi:hypothetical protein
MDLPAGVIPLYGESAISLSFPICRALIIFSYCLQQVLRMLFADIFDAKIVHDEAETNRASVVFPQSRGCGALAIAMFCQSLFQ